MPRIEVAVTYNDGTREIVNAGKPAVLVAFGDEHGHPGPESPREIAWLVHRALGVEEPLNEWLDTLDDLDGSEDAVAEMVKDGVKRPTPSRPTKSGEK